MDCKWFSLRVKTGKENSVKEFITLDTFLHTRFPGVLLKPLGHHSI